VRETGGDVTVQLAERGRVRTLFRVAPPPGPPAAASPEYDTTVAQRSTALAASPSHMAFVRAVTPPSGATLPTGRAPLRGALGGDAPLLAAVARPAQPRLRALAGGRPPSPGAPCVRARPTDVDGSGARVVYSELVEDCGPTARRSTRIVALEPAARGYRSRVLARSARSRLPSGFDLDGEHVTFALSRRLEQRASERDDPRWETSLYLAPAR